MKYLITYHTQLNNGYIDEREIIVKNKYNARNIYNNICGKKRTINIEMEELYWHTQHTIEFLLTIKTILFC